MDFDQRLNASRFQGAGVPDFDTADSSGGTKTGNPVPLLYYYYLRDFFKELLRYFFKSTWMRISSYE
jgi:hypothetical protein